MTRNDVKKLFGAMNALYPNFHPEDLACALDTWAAVLSDADAQSIMSALYIYARTDTTGFAPSIGALMNAKQSITDNAGALAAWAQVSRAIRNGVYNAVEEFEKLPPVAQKAIGAASMLRTWALDENYNELVVQSHFIKAYNEIYEREKTAAMIPQRLRDMIEKGDNNAKGDKESALVEKQGGALPAPRTV